MKEKEIEEMLRKLASYLYLEEVPNSWKIVFLKIENNEDIQWITEQKLEESLSFYQIEDKNFIRKCKQKLKEIQENKELNLLGYLLHYILFIDDTFLYREIWDWKYQTNPKESMLPLLVLLSGYQKHQKVFLEKRYNEEQIQEQIRNIKKCCFQDKLRFEIEGVRLSQMVWASYFINGKIIQLGRLQYEFDYVVPKQIKDYCQEQKEEYYVKMHIPAGKDLKIEEVQKSILQAKEWIHSNLDGHPMIFYTESWLLSDNLKDCLNPENSNIFQFRKLFQIIAQEENQKDFYDFLFQEYKKISPSLLREDTSLQRKIKEKLLREETLSIGLGVLHS